MEPGKIRANSDALSSAYAKKHNTDKPTTDNSKTTNPALTGPTTADRLAAYKSPLDTLVSEQPQAETAHQAADTRDKLPSAVDGSDRRFYIMASDASGDPDILRNYDAQYQAVRANEASAARAAEDFAEYSNYGILTTAELADRMVDNVDDPAYLSEMIRLSHEGEILDSFVHPLYLRLFDRTNGQYTDNNTQANERRNAFIAGINAALDSGAITEQDIRNYGAYSDGWQTLANLTGISRVGVTLASEATTIELKHLQDAQNDAQENVDRLNRELMALLSLPGPMTEEQRVALINDFQNNPEHKPTYDALLDATSALSEFTMNNQAAVLDAAVRDPDAAELVAETITDLANNGYGKEAIELLSEIHADPNSAEAAAFSGFEELSDEVLVNAAGSAMAQLLAENNGDLELSESQFVELFNTFIQGSPAFLGFKDVAGGLDMMTDFSRGDFNHADYYSHIFNEKTNPISRAYAMGALVIGSVAAYNLGREGDYLNAVNAFAQSGEATSRAIAAGAFNGLAKSGRIAQHTGHFSGFAARMAPGLALIASSTSLVNSLHETFDDNINLGYAVAALGDAIGVFVGVLELLGPTAPAGVFYSGIGAVISGLGSVAGEMINNRERRQMLENYLQDAGVDESIASIMARLGPQLFDMSESLSMSPEQVQSLLESHTGIGNSPGHISSFTEIANAHGMEGQEVLEFADRLATANPDFANRIFDDVSAIGTTNPDDRARTLRELVTANYTQASALAQTLSPELYGVEDQVRNDFEDARYTIGWETELAGLLNRNDDPEYQVELIRLMKEDDSLEQVAMNAGFFWPESFDNALEQAVQAGVISRSEADHLAQND